MAVEREQAGNIVSLEKYQELGTVVPTKLTPFSAKNNPLYFSAHPEILEQFERLKTLREEQRSRKTNIDKNAYRSLWAQAYITLPLSEMSFLEAAGDGMIDAKELLQYQMKREYMSKRLIFQEDPNFAPPYINSRRREEIDKKFGPGGRDPDLRFPRRSESPNPRINTLFALKLAQGKVVHDGIRITSLSELSLYAEEISIPLDGSALRNGFHRLTQINTIGELLETGAISQDDLPELYERISVFMADIALSEIFKKKNEAIVFPYNTEFDPKDSPDIYFLPFLATSFLRFMVKLPEHIQTNQQVDPRSLYNSLKRLQNFNQEVIANYLIRSLGIQGRLPIAELFNKALEIQPETASDVKAVSDALNNLSISFQKVFAHYRANPLLINRVIPQRGASIAAVTYPEWRDELLEYCDTAPVKPGKFRFGGETKP